MRICVLEKKNPACGGVFLWNEVVCWFGLELEAQAELHNAGGMGAVERQETTGCASRIARVESGCAHAAHWGGDSGSAGAGSAAEGIQLGVIENVEIFPTEFEARSVP